MLKVVGIRFKKAGKIYYFDPVDTGVEVGDHVIVETVRGLEYGTVVIGAREVEENKLVSQAVHDIGYLNLCTAEHDMFSRFQHVYNILLQREKDEFKIESTLASIGLYQSNIAKIEAK